MTPMALLPCSKTQRADAITSPALRPFRSHIIDRALQDAWWAWVGAVRALRTGRVPLGIGRGGHVPAGMEAEWKTLPRMRLRSRVGIGAALGGTFALVSMLASTLVLIEIVSVSALAVLVGIGLAATYLVGLGASAVQGVAIDSPSGAMASSPTPSPTSACTATPESRETTVRSGVRASGRSGVRVARCPLGQCSSASFHRGAYAVCDCRHAPGVGAERTALDRLGGARTVGQQPPNPRRSPQLVAIGARQLARPRAQSAQLDLASIVKKLFVSMSRALGAPVHGWEATTRASIRDC